MTYSSYYEKSVVNFEVVLNDINQSKYDSLKKNEEVLSERIDAV